MKRKHNNGVVAPPIARGTLWAPVSNDGRQGLTVTEVLVCISVLGLLLTLVLPAVQRARETSRLTECVNNLKQLGVAVHNLEGVTNSFPHPDGHLISLLPHLGQNTLHEQLKGYENRGVSLSKLTGDVRLFQCPSDGERRSGEFQTNYFLNGGTAISVFEANGMVKRPTGSYYRAVKPVRAQEVRDGLSNTALYCERLDIPRGTFRSETELTAFARNSPVRFLWSTDEDYLQSESAVLAADCQFPENRVAVGTYSDPGRTFTDVSAIYYHTSNPNSVGCFRYKHNPRKSWFATLGNATIPASSNHDGTVNLLLADGSVRNLSENIALDTWRALGTRSDADRPGMY